MALGLLDEVLSGQRSDAPAGIGARTRLSRGHWAGERAARDILDFARRGRAFGRSEGSSRQGSPAVQSGAALALAATMQTWCDEIGTPVDEITTSVFR